MITKPLSNRYIQDPTLLVELLKRLFGSDFRIEVITSTGGIIQSCTVSLTCESRKSPIVTYLLPREN